MNLSAIKVYALTLIFLRIFPAQAALTPFSCSTTPLRVMFINGMMTAIPTGLPTDRLRSAHKLLQKIVGGGFEFDSKGVVFEEPFYNRRDGFSGEILEGIALKIGATGSTWTKEETRELAKDFFYDPQKFYTEYRDAGWTDAEIEEELNSLAQYAMGNSTAGTVLSLYAKIFPILNAGEKFFLVGHSSGTLIIREVHALLSKNLSAEKMKLFAGVLLGPALVFQPISADGKERFPYVLNSKDLPMRPLSLKFANMEGPFTWSELGHGILETYLGTSEVKTAEGLMTAADFFKIKITEAISTLSNNSADCCNKAEGKFWANCDYKLDPGCVGGFISEKMKLSPNMNDANLFVEKESYICANGKIGYGTFGPLPSNIRIGQNSVLTGRVTLSGKVEMNEVIATGSNSNNSNQGVLLEARCSTGTVFKKSSLVGDISGDVCGSINNASISGYVKLSGKINVDTSIVSGISYSPTATPLRILGSGTTGIRVFASSNLTGNALFEGDLLLSNAGISGAGIYKGTRQAISSGQTFTSQLSGNGFSGSNNFSGLYVIGAGISNVKVMGGFFQASADDWIVTTIASGGFAGSGASITGPTVIEGNVGPGAIVENLVTGALGSSYIGSGSAFNGAGKKMSGVLAINEGSHVDGTNIIATQTPSSAAMNISNSQVIDSTINGRGSISNSSEVDNALIEGVGFSISHAYLNGTIVNGSPKLCDRTYGRGPYDSSYNCDSEKMWKVSSLEDWDAAMKRARAMVIFD